MTAVRPARPDDALDVRRILDGSMLEPGDVEARIEAGDVLVAVAARPGFADGSHDDDRVIGAAVLEPDEGGAHLAAIAVRRRRRDRGVGTALVEAAVAREGRVTARFDADVVPFYESLGFEIEPIDDRRFEGVRSDDRSSDRGDDS